MTSTFRMKKAHYRFGAHRALAERAGDLLSEFSISTKVGFFPRSGRSEHSLDPQRLRHAVEESVDTLGVPPQVVFLHNPEHTLHGCEAAHGRDLLNAACTELATMVREGLCGCWGIASWNPGPLANLVGDDEETAIRTAPQVFMSRVGLTVSPRALEAIEVVTQAWGMPREQRWGMSPFAGRSTDPVWKRVNARTFLEGEPKCSNLAAVFRVACELPEVSRVAAGTNQLRHLAELLQAARLSVNTEVLTQYRLLLGSARPVNEPV